MSDSDKQIEAATKELQEVCAKHKVEVVAYIHSLGPRIAIIPVNNEAPTKQDSGNDAPEGRGASPSDERPVSKSNKDS